MCKREPLDKRFYDGCVSGMCKGGGGVILLTPLAGQTCGRVHRSGHGQTFGYCVGVLLLFGVC